MTTHAPDPEPMTSLHVRRAIDGDAQSLSWIIGRLTPLLVAQATYRLGPQLRSLYESTELVHEAWLVTLPKLAELEPHDGRFTPVLLRFLSTSLIYKINNLARKHARAEPVEPLPEQEGELIDERTGVVSQAVRSEARNIVHVCLEELEDIDRQIILLRGIEQQSNKNVAIMLQMKPQTVAMRYHRALGRLRQRLPGSVFDELEDEDLPAT